MALLLICLVPGSPRSEVQWNRVAFAGATVFTWTCIGINEGQKWSENYDLVFHEDYHLYRAGTGAGLIATPALALTLDLNRRDLGLVLSSNLIGWGVYEVALGLASGRGPFEDRPDFHILGLEFPFPRPAAILGLASALAFTVQISL